MRISLDRLRADLMRRPYIGDEASLKLRQQVVKCALEQGIPIYDSDDKDRLGEGIISIKMLGVVPYGWWAGDDDLREWFTKEHERMAEAKRKKEDVSVWLMAGTAQFDRAAVELCAAHFIVSAGAGMGGPQTVYQITDWDRREVVPIPDKKEDRVVAYSRVCAPVLAEDNVGTGYALMQQIDLAFRTHAPLVPAPSLLGQPEDNDWCLKRATVRPDPTMDFPYCRQFVDRLHDPEAFGAFLWGIYSGLNLGRQILYVSESGEGGKSKFISAITTALFGERICSSYPAHSVIAKNAHANSSFVGKRLVVIGDCGNRFILHSQMFKELSGDDASWVNPKYQTPYTVRFACRAMVFGNVKPAIVNERHNTSRTLWIILDPLPADTTIDPRYGEKCARELPGFLAWCERCYAERCSNDYAIRVNERMQKATNLRIAESEGEFVDQFDQFFVLDENGTLTSKEFIATLRGLNNHEKEDFRAWIVARHPAISERLEAAPNGRPAKWAMSGVRTRTGGDHWRAEAERPRARPFNHDAAEQFHFDTAED